MERQQGIKFSYGQKCNVFMANVSILNFMIEIFCRHRGLEAVAEVNQTTSVNLYVVNRVVVNYIIFQILKMACCTLAEVIIIFFLNSLVKFARVLNIFFGFKIIVFLYLVQVSLL